MRDIQVLDEEAQRGLPRRFLRKQGEVEVRVAPRGLLVAGVMAGLQVDADAVAVEPRRGIQVVDVKGGETGSNLCHGCPPVFRP